MILSPLSALERPFLVSKDKGRVLDFAFHALPRCPKSCNRWSCREGCYVRKAHTWASSILDDLDHAASLGIHCRRFEFTDQRKLPMILHELRDSVEYLRAILTEKGVIWDYGIQILGPSSRRTNRLHLHVVGIGGSYIHHTNLRTYAQRAGLGLRIGVQEVKGTAEDRRDDANYMGKNLVEHAQARHCLGATLQAVPATRTGTPPWSP